jgi:glycosyltransferase involved in cell wall biosynthesis
MRVTGFSRQFEGGGYYRIRLPLDELGLHGHDTEHLPAKSDRDAPGADVVVGQLVGGFEHPGAVHSWWRRQFKHSKLVYETDDDPFSIEPHNPAATAYGRPEMRDSIAHCIEISALVTVSTDPLAEQMAKINPNVVVLKNRIDEHVLGIERPRRDRLTIGWAGGNSHLHDIEQCAWGLRKTMQRFPDVDLHFIGEDYTGLVRSPRPARFTGWASRTVDYYRLVDFDIGLAPLAPTFFARSKSAIKALEYSALGIPVVASDAAPYRDFVVDGVTGFLIRHDHEWAARLRELIEDEPMRTEMGAKAKELAAGWTIQKGWPEWESAYSSLL